MGTRTWSLTLDNAPITLRLDHDPNEHTLVVVVDGFPYKRASLPEVIDTVACVVVDVSGHRVAAYVVAAPFGFGLDVAVDGTSLTTGRPEDTIGAPSGGWQRRATLPGRFHANASRYYQLVPGWARVSAATVVVGASLAVVGAVRAALLGEADDLSTGLLVGAMVFAITGVGWWWNDWNRVTARFACGDVMAGVVVGLAPVRVAVAADLARRPNTFYPAVLVSTQPIDEAAHLDGTAGPALGDPVLVLVVKEASENGRWYNTVVSVAAALGTDDHAAIDRSRAALPTTAWTRVTTWHRLAGAPTAPGIHPIRDLPRSGFAQD